MKKNTLLFLLIFIYQIQPSFTQNSCPSFLMQGFNYDFGKYGNGYNWADTLKSKAACIGKAGFTHLWFPGHYGNGVYSSGYNPRDLYMGETTGLGTPNGVRAMITALNNAGIDPVGDFIYNHRDGGKAEKNPALEEYIQYRAGGTQKPYPSDRYHVVIPLGGSSGNGAGDYYININSRTQTYNGAKYMFYATTNKIGGSRWSPINATQGPSPVEGAEPFIAMLGTNYENTINSNGDSDEFKITVTGADFNAAGDQLIIYMVNTNGYADQRIWKIWNGTTDLVGKSGGTGANNVANVYSDIVEYHSYTDFSTMPSGLGTMDWNNFRPNYNAVFTGTSGNWTVESLAPDYSMRSMDYFYDYDHIVTDTRDKLIEWTEWNFTKTVGGSSPLGIKALRMDAVKHFDPSFVPSMLNKLYADGITPSMVIGEYYGTNRTDLQNWVQSIYNNGFNASAPIAMHPRVFDFNLRDALRNATNNRLGVGDFRYIYTEGLVGGGYLSGNNVVTFLNNHDFRHDYEPTHGEALVHYDAMLAYAYLLTNNQLGVPTVYYDDYFGYPATSSPLYQTYFPTTLSPMKCEIDALMALHKKYIFGSPSVSYLNKSGSGFTANYTSSSADKCLIYQLNAPTSTGKRVIVAINFSDNTLKVNHQIAGTTTAGTTFTDMLRRSAFPSTTINGSGQIYMEVPPRNYSVWVEGNDEPIVPKPTITTIPAVVDVNSVMTTTLNSGQTFKLMGNYTANTTSCASVAQTPEITYKWTGPDGFTSNLQNPEITNINTTKAGDYTLTLNYDCATCTSSTATTRLVINIAISLDLLSFQAELNNNTNTRLSWQTADEQNVSLFEIQRSTNGKDFTPLSILQAKNGKKQVYQTFDETPSMGINYYRLKMINADDSYQYSKTESVSKIEKTTFNVFPNPVEKNHSLWIESNKNESFDFTLFDAQGKQVFYKKLNNTTNSIDTKLFTKGFYIYKIKTESVNQTGKIFLE